MEGLGMGRGIIISCHPQRRVNLRWQVLYFSERFKGRKRLLNPAGKPRKPHQKGEVPRAWLFLIFLFNCPTMNVLLQSFSTQGKSGVRND